MALAVGVSSLKERNNFEEDSFGLVGITSIGPILSIVLSWIVSKQNKLSEVAVNQMSLSSSVLYPFIQKLPIIMSEIMLAILPLLVVFILYKLVVKDLSKSIHSNSERTDLCLFWISDFARCQCRIYGSWIYGGYKVASLNGQWIIVIVGFI